LKRFFVAVINKTNAEIAFVKVPEAKEYRESLIIRDKQAQSNEPDESGGETSAYPTASELFAEV
jgi:hypothetical protein